eukprot:6736857-Prymnesium_polylepis.1
MPVFLGKKKNNSKFILPITSMNEDRVLRELGLALDVRNEIEGLHGGRSSSAAALSGLTEEQQMSRAVARLTANPPIEVGVMQRRACSYLVRPFPLGLRFSGKNMSPLPSWLA